MSEALRAGLAGLVRARARLSARRRRAGGRRDPHQRAGAHPARSRPPSSPGARRPRTRWAREPVTPAASSARPSTARGRRPRSSAAGWPARRGRSAAEGVVLVLGLRVRRPEAPPRRSGTPLGVMVPSRKWRNISRKPSCSSLTSSNMAPSWKASPIWVHQTTRAGQHQRLREGVVAEREHQVDRGDLPGCHRFAGDEADPVAREVPGPHLQPAPVGKDESGIDVDGVTRMAARLLWQAHGPRREAPAPRQRENSPPLTASSSASSSSTRSRAPVASRGGLPARIDEETPSLEIHAVHLRFDLSSHVRHS